MDYKKDYFIILNEAKKKDRKKGDGNYYEEHHTLPRSWGGKDEEDNLVLLTAREHYIAHYLLWKFSEGLEKGKMACAFLMMTDRNHRHGKDIKIIPSRAYEKLKKQRVEYIKQKAALRKKDKLPTIIRLEDAKTYKTYKDCCDDLGISQGTIGRVIDKDHNTARSYHLAHYKKGVDYTKNKWYGKEPEGYFGMKIICLETLKVFDTQTEAAKYCGMKVSSIWRCLEDEENTFAGYHWAKYDKNKDYSNNKWYGRGQSKGIKVICLETLEIFENLREAGEKYNLGSAMLTDVLKGNQKTFAGYHWEEYDSQKDYTKNEWYGKPQIKRIRKIKCLTNNKVYDNVVLASKDLDISKESIRAVLKGRKKEVKGCKFVYED